MTIAELFVTIGVKGTQAMQGALKGAKDGISSITDASLEAKAAVLGIIYGLERLTGSASQRGMDLTKFNLTTGLDTDDIQKWQYVARQYDVSAQEIESTILNLQNVLADVKLGKGIPASAKLLGITSLAQSNPLVLAKELVEKAHQKNIDPGVLRQLFKDFGLSDNLFQMFHAMDVNAVDKVGKSKLLSHETIDALTKVNRQWKEFWYTLELFGQNKVAQYGPEAIKGLQKGFGWVLDTTKNIQMLTKEFPILQKVAVAAIAAIALELQPISALILALAAAVTYIASLQKEENMQKDQDKAFQDFTRKRGIDPNKITQKEMQDFVQDYRKKTGQEPLKINATPNTGPKKVSDLIKQDFDLNYLKLKMAPDTSKLRGTTPGPEKGQVINLNMTNHIQGVKDAADLGKHVGKEIKKTAAQLVPLVRTQ